MTPEDLLGCAGMLLTAPSGYSSRTCAMLTRAALEAGIDRYWRRAVPDSPRARMRTKLLVLRHDAGAVLADQAAECWSCLSRAAHHHAYELEPLAAELRGWHEGVGKFLHQLGKIA